VHRSGDGTAQAGKVVRMVSTPIRQGAAATLAATMLLAGCAGDASDRRPGDGETPPTDGLTIKVTETEYTLNAEPRDGLIPASYTFLVQNDGNETHALAIRGPGVDEQTQQIPAGEEPVEFAVPLRPGTYELWCPVGDHRDRGMQMSLLVEAL
jgi:hypothetical protein